jgi:ABC-type polysaccharide/polyol phosphate export permease
MTTRREGARVAFDLIAALAKADLRVRAGRGRLRMLKWIVDPFAAIGVYLILVSVVLDVRGPEPGLSIACAVVPFQLFMMSIANALRAIEVRSAIVGNMAFDTRLLPVVSVVVETVAFSAALVLLAIIMAVYGVAPTPALLALPVVIVVTMVLSLAVAYPAALIGLWFPELQPFVVSAARTLYFVAPGVVALAQIHGSANEQIRINPLTGVFEAFRAIVLRGEIPAAWQLLIPLGVSLVLLAVFLPLWRSESAHFAKVLS